MEYPADPLAIHANNPPEREAMDCDRTVGNKAHSVQGLPPLNASLCNLDPRKQRYENSKEQSKLASPFISDLFNTCDP